MTNHQPFPQRVPCLGGIKTTIFGGELHKALPSSAREATEGTFCSVYCACGPRAGFNVLRHSTAADADATATGSAYPGSSGTRNPGATAVTRNQPNNDNG
jgi:hypothetical protein